MKCICTKSTVKIKGINNESSGLNHCAEKLEYLEIPSELIISVAFFAAMVKIT